LDCCTGIGRSDLEFAWNLHGHFLEPCDQRMA